MTVAAPGPKYQAHAAPDRARQLIHGVYRPPARITNWRLEQLVGHDRVRYFSLGRHALAAALRAGGVKAGGTVLLPGFICREVLAALHAVRATPAYYPVNSSLALACDPARLPAAQAVLAVDYFGFPQDLAPFMQYCARTGAVLVEDNAHGLFSRDADGRVLGARGDIGIFSLRKTLVTPDGAAFAVNQEKFAPALPPQLAFDAARASASFRIKNAIRGLTPLTGIGPARLATTFARMIRQVRSGYRIAPPSPDAEVRIPGRAAPSRELLDVMTHTDVVAESARRRALYQCMREVLSPVRYPPLFGELPDYVVPYGYPFIADSGAAAAASRELAQLGLECFGWPELPGAIAPAASPHYKTVRMVSFLW